MNKRKLDFFFTNGTTEFLLEKEKITVFGHERASLYHSPPFGFLLFRQSGNPKGIKNFF
jgi:hypothetical protein